MSFKEVMSLLGGIGLFLYGMTLMSTGLKKACGNKLQTILEHATKSTGRAVLVGTGLTMLVQSSSATGAMVIGFVSSGFMTLIQAAGVILGANIGTTVTAQITAFNLSAYAPLMIFFGALMAMFVKNELARSLGTFLLGFGMLFQGISFMKGAIAPLADDPEAIAMLARMESPVLLILIGLVFTALLQSSSSSTVIIQAFAAEGIISFPCAIYLLVGAAIGAVAPNFLAAMTTNRNGLRTAFINLIFNTFRMILVLLLIGLVPKSIDLIVSLSPGDVARQVANAHTFFALISVAVCFPFAALLVKLVELILPPSEEETRQKDNYRLHFMDNLIKLPPSIALKLARREISRMGQIALNNLEVAVDCFFAPDRDKVKMVADQEAVMDWLDRAIIEKLSSLKARELSVKDMDTLYHMTLTVSDMERLSDLAENLAEHSVRMQQEGGNLISAVGMQELKEMADLTLKSVALGIGIFNTGDYNRLPEAEAMEQAVDNKQEALVASHVARLMKKSCDPLGGVIFTDFVTEMERCSDHALNIAYSLSGLRENKSASAILMAEENRA